MSLICMQVNCDHGPAGVDPESGLGASEYSTPKKGKIISHQPFNKYTEWLTF